MMNGNHNGIALFSGLLAVIVFDASFGYTQTAFRSKSLTGCRAIRIVRSNAQNDRLGESLAAAGDINGDGFRDVLIGAPGFDLSDHPSDDCGAAIVIWGNSLAGLSGMTLDIDRMDDRGMILLGARGSQAGYSVAGVGDLNADGYADIAVGTGLAVHASLVFGSPQWKGLLNLASKSVPNSTIVNIGYSVAGAGDMNGDGFEDVAFGNPFAEMEEADDGGSYFGRVFVLWGCANLPEIIDPLKPGNLGFTFRSRGETLVGEALSPAGDVNGDGFMDLLIAAPRAGDRNQGRAYLLRGQSRITPPVPIEVAVDGVNDNISHLGDINGDGFDDMMFSTRDFRCILVWGKQQLPDKIDLNHELPENLGVTFEGAGYGVGIDDLNGDGFNDLAFGLPFQSSQDREGAGQVVIVFGQSFWPTRINLLNPEVPYITIDGEERHRGFGTTIAALGDIEGDGLADLIVSAPVHPLEGHGLKVGSEEVYVILGSGLVDAFPGKNPPQ